MNNKYLEAGKRKILIVQKQKQFHTGMWLDNETQENYNRCLNNAKYD